MQGLQGKADRKNTGVITLDDLHKYARDETKQFVRREIDAEQEPTIAKFPIEGGTVASDIEIGYWEPVKDDTHQPEIPPPSQPAPSPARQAMSTPVLKKAVASGTAAIAVEWSAVENADIYQLEYSTDSKFSNASTATYRNTSGTFGGLTPGTTYYVRVFARGDSMKYTDSPFSTLLTATTDKAVPPSSSVSATPGNRSSGGSSSGGGGSSRGSFGSKL